ncbi:malonate decarboxylase holo-ACP synthase [Pantoea agglomerans]|uniref:malonate decarboxylase holo-ACP synthase n=1 Tax=Enterobacter agglomerans TaxID=549 RepID=UPI001782CB5E|nr:malonate decarboxylase holo-ACP synthase [Pantoea agglomerans]MBD8250704.1 malonate decarboxylase holo-ACP synthase [Pantoea agglomerans]WAB88074.1 malonate decarboxylase holo-ACP synthase [Pantoea agglomerans]
MSSVPRPHDLLWLRDGNALAAISESWVSQFWHPGLPVVVRRDRSETGLIPVGVRGERREQRAAGWVNAADIVRVATPEMLAARAQLLASPFTAYAPVGAAIALSEHDWPWRWGITGSTGYALATQQPTLHAASDLDLVIRAPEPLARDALQRWQAQTDTLACRVDTQVETPSGAFALSEWLREGRALVKTVTGPILTASPWSRELQ